ncbi:MAG TPA: A/G-specific adenine glycosylase [Thermotogota bacterium]|nr:A/G-specific adenine glycosylase [Thermotogota bacterium]HRW34891.1 A/G-specific adenine glycosylase [Thermotogota bacterium]
MANIRFWFVEIWYAFINEDEGVKDKMSFQQALLKWYQVHQRTLPFRESLDPYHIWISEIMLQQTQMDTVLPYYKRFMEAFPTVYDLAKAPQERVMHLWAGLGYYSRARNLHKCAKVIVEKHQGRFPEDYQEALKLPGIGPYTAGAVLSIAYNQPIPAVDGNVLRVFSRLFDSHLDIGEAKNKRVIQNQIRELIPDNARDFNQALMELGALVCLPKKPRCESCPLTNSCQAKERSLQDELPVKRKKIKNKKIPVAVGIIKKHNKIMITKASTELLNGLWGFPIAEGKNTENAKEQLINYLKETINKGTCSLKVIGSTKHVFTHKTWMMTLYENNYPGELNEEVLQQYDNDKSMAKNEEIKWVTLEDLSKYPMATAFKKLLKRF